MSAKVEMYNLMRKEKKEFKEQMHREGKKQYYLWSKHLMLAKIEEIRSDIDCSKLSVDELREICLKFSDTVNDIEYYEFSEKGVKELNQDKIDGLIKKRKAFHRNRRLKRECLSEYLSIVEKYDLSPIYEDYSCIEIVKKELEYIKTLENNYEDSYDTLEDIKQYVRDKVMHDTEHSECYIWK